jgi:hypothetical protein
MRKELLLACTGAWLAVAAPGCADDVGRDELASVELLDLYRSFDDLDLGDLLAVAAGWATNELNDALRLSDYAGIRLGDTELYAPSAVAAGDVTLHDVDALVSGLVERFGHRELTTEVNRVRQQHLATTAAELYAENAFRVRAGIHDWGFTVGGFGGAGVRVGFDAGVDLEARVIRAVGSELVGHLTAPLAAIADSRGFVLPRSIEDLRALAPGESYALRGAGKLGVNVGVGVPVLITTFEALSYSVVLSAALRALVQGSIDVQVVRLAGDELVIDVGVEQGAVKQARLALDDGWGVHGLLQSRVAIGGVSVDLGELVEGALERMLNRKLSLVSATLDSTQTYSRLSVARFRVDLAAATPGSPVEQAVAHALKADLRLAQALANRSDGGIVAEFELSRSGVSATSYAGIDLLGMSFFRKVVEGEGSIVVQTPGGARTILFDSLHRSSGWLFSSHGFTRVGLSGLVVDGDDAHGEANLVFQVMEGDKKMERDKLADHLDGVVLALGGEAALKAFEQPANDVERFVEEACPESGAFDPCRVAVLDDPALVALREQARSALWAATAGLEPAARDLCRKAGEMRIVAQAAYEPKATFTGPPTSVVLDYRLDDGALDAVLGERSRTNLEQAVTAYANAAGLDRFLFDVYTAPGDPFDSSAARAELWDDVGARVAAAGAIFAAHQQRFRGIVQAETMTLPRHPELGEMGPRAIEIRFGVAHDQVPLYEEATVRSLAHARAEVTTALADDLVDVLDGVAGKHGEQVAAYALLALTPATEIDLRLDLDVSVDDSWEQTYPQYRKAGYASFDVYVRGSEVDRIDGGLFDLDALLELK